MSSVRFTFSCPVDADWDIIEYLDGFSTPADRNVAIKAAVRHQMMEIEEKSHQIEQIGDLGELFKTEMEKMLSLLQELKSSGIAVPETFSIRASDGEHEVALKNIDKLLSNGEN